MFVQPDSLTPAQEYNLDSSGGGLELNIIIMNANAITNHNIFHIHSKILLYFFL